MDGLLITCSQCHPPWYLSRLGQQRLYHHNFCDCDERVTAAAAAHGRRHEIYTKYVVMAGEADDTAGSISVWSSLGASTGANTLDNEVEAMAIGVVGIIDREEDERRGVVFEGKAVESAAGALALFAVCGSPGGRWKCDVHE